MYNFKGSYLTRKCFWGVIWGKEEFSWFCLIQQYLTIMYKQRGLGIKRYLLPSSCWQADISLIQLYMTEITEAVQCMNKAESVQRRYVLNWVWRDL